MKLKRILKKEAKLKRIKRFSALIFLLVFIIIILRSLLPSRHKRNKLDEPTKEIEETLPVIEPELPTTVDTHENSNYDIYLSENWHKHSGEIKKTLSEAKVLDIEPMKDFLLRNKKQAIFSGSVFKVTLEGGIQAVFKTTSDGKMVRDRMEETAYDFSVYTNLAYVPPTVHRTLECDFNKNGHVQKKSGFLSLFVDTEFDLLKYTKEKFYALLSKISEDELCNYKTFNFVFGNWDVGPHNVLVAKDGTKENPHYHLIAIDNEGMANLQKVQYGKVPFVRWLTCPGAGRNVRDFPFDQAKTSDKASRQAIANRFNQWPPGRKHNYSLFGGAYWTQYTDFWWGAESNTTDLLYPERLTETAKEKLKNLTKENLLALIAQSNDITDFMKARVDGFIERRDMLFKHFSIT
ncbi:hypothetical protein FACS1894198_5470 [Clostridia bacterium]|nr:hypothetical protein FACS1894198_5470 [Clostridia bacterium]